jgi:hypothetical protein
MDGTGGYHLNAGKWMEMENTILSEVSQVQKTKGLHVFSHMWNIGTIQIQVILYIHINIHEHVPKGGNGRETKGGGKVGKKDSKK